MSALAVSVVVPAYNRANTLARALRSVHAQVPSRPSEIILVDDGSDDDTAAVGERWCARVIRLGSNQGLSAARNTALRAARHRWIALLDSDDEWLPAHLSTLWPLRDGHLAVASAVVAGSAGDWRYLGVTAREPRALVTAADLLHPESFIVPSATLLDRDAALAVGGYDERLRAVEDLDLLLRLLAEGTVMTTPTVTALWHAHDGQMSGDLDAVRAVHDRVLRRHVDRGPVLRSAEARRRWDALRASRTSRERRRHAGGLLIRPSLLPALALVLRGRARRRRLLAGLRRSGLTLPEVRG